MIFPYLFSISKFDNVNETKRVYSISQITELNMSNDITVPSIKQNPNNQTYN